MSKLYRFSILVLLIVAALSAYSYGSTSGLFVFIIIGFIFEGMFWIRLFRKKKE